MRCLLMSDTQIGATTVDLSDQQAVLEQAVTLAIENDVQAVLHAGDVFEGKSEGGAMVSPEQLRMFIDATEPLRTGGIPIVVIRGNGTHDSAKRRVHALDVLREIDGFTVSDRPELLLPTAQFAVCTLPWVSPDRLIAQHEGEVDHDAVNSATSRILVSIAADLRKQASAIQAGTFGPANLPTILMAHWAVSGSKLPSGMSVDEMREPILPWADLDALGYDLIVAGHIHEPQRLDNPDVGDRTVGIVPGSPQQLNFGESGKHGVWLLDLHPPVGVEVEFMPLKSREFVTLDVDVAGEGDPIAPGAWLLTAFSPETLNHVCPDSYVRLRYTATEAQASGIDHDALRAHLLSHRPHSVKIEPTIIRERRVRSVAMTEQDGPLDSLAAYCESEAVDEGLALRMGATLRDWTHGAE